jgi:hypothetical protein
MACYRDSFIFLRTAHIESMQENYTYYLNKVSWFERSGLKDNKMGQAELE